MKPMPSAERGFQRETIRIVDVINLGTSAETLLRERVLALRAKGIDNKVVCIDGPAVARLLAAGVPVHTVPLPRGLDPLKLVRSTLELARWFRQVRPDIVHTHCTVPGVVGRLAARLAGVPVVMHTVHGFWFHDDSPAFERWLGVAVESFVGRFTDLLLSQNHADIEQALRHRIVPRDRVRHVGNGITLARFPVAPPRLATGVPVIVCVARFEPVKNHDQLIEAARLLAAQGQVFELRLIGGGEGQARCEARVREAGLESRVRFLGYRDDISAQLADSDIAVLTSRKEGIPRAALEAMAAGRPVVATRVTGTREVVRDGDTGMLVGIDDAPALAAALTRLLADPTECARMGARGREVVEAEFDEDEVVRRIERAYRAGLRLRGLPVPAALTQEVRA